MSPAPVLDLDHLRPLIGEQSGGERSGHDSREIQHLVTAERPVLRRRLVSVSRAVG